MIARIGSLKANYFLPTFAAILTITSLLFTCATFIQAYSIPTIRFPSYNIGLGKTPDTIAVNPNTNKVYVGTFHSNTISVIDGTTDRLVKTINMTTVGNGIAVNPNTNKVYVSGDSNTISVIDGTTDRLVKTINLRSNPFEIVLNPNTNKVYVRAVDSNTISVIDGTTDRLVKTINLTFSPTAIDVNPNTDKMYLVDNSNTTYVIDGSKDKVVGNITAGTLISSISADPTNNKAYAFDSVNNHILIIDGSKDKVVGNITVGHDLSASSLINSDPNTGFIYVGDTDSGHIYVIDIKTDKVLPGYIKLRGHGISTIAVNPNTNKVYVANSASDTVSVIDGSKDKVIRDYISTVYSKVNSTSTKRFAGNPISPTSKGFKTNEQISQIGLLGVPQISLPIGSFEPSAIAVNPNTNKVYVANSASDTVSVIDGSKDKVVGNITTGDVSIHSSLAVIPKTNKVYIAHSSSNIIYIVDGSKDKVVGNITTGIPIGDSPYAIAVNPNTNKVYLGINESDTVSVIDGSKDKVVGNITTGIPIGDSPSAIAVNPNTNKVYVANSASDTVSVIDGSKDKVVGNISVGHGPYAIAVNPNNSKIYVALKGGSRISIIDDNTNNVKRALISANYSLVDQLSLAIDPNTGIAYMPHRDLYKHADSVLVIDRFYRVIADIPVGDNPSAIAVNPNTNKVYVANSLSSTVSVINGNVNTTQPNKSELDTTGIPIGGSPSAIAVNPNTNKVYVANSASDTVSVIDGSKDKVAGNILLNGVPFALAVNPNTNKVYVAIVGNNTVSVIDGSKDKVVGNITVGDGPSGEAIAIDASSNRLYVASSSSDTVSIIDLSKDKVVGTVSVSNPYAMAFDRNTYRLFVCCGDHESRDTVSIIDLSKDKVVRNVTLNNPGTAIAVNDYSGDAYVAEESGMISTLDHTTNSVTDTISTGVPLRQFFSSSPSVDESVNPNTGIIYTIHSDFDTISVIDPITDSIVANIPVAHSPLGISINPITNTAYVTNSGSGTVSVIDGKTYKVITTMNFNINPPYSGHIRCNNKDITTNVNLRIEYNTLCIGQPNKGFRFVSWSKNLGNNSSKTITTPTKESSWFDSLLNFVGFNINNDDKSNIFNTTQYGNFTANFEKIPPPVPPEYYIPLYGIIVSSLVGWSIPTIIGWIKARRQIRKVNQYHKRITSLYADDKLDKNDIKSLNALKRDITDAYAAGKINEQHYNNLKDEISRHYQKIYKNKIYSLKGKSEGSNSSNGVQWDKIKNDIADAYAAGKISEQHYNLLKDTISDYKNNR
jgi:YVTN family beta-propeller protein